MLGLVTILIVLTSYLYDVDANDCSSSGIFVDIHERLVDGREDFFQYGLFIGLGTPSQNNSLWPAIVHNETTFSAPDYCGSKSPASCGQNFHGFFSGEQSSSWRETPNYQSLDDPSIIVNTTPIHGTDTLNIWTHYFDPSRATGTFLQDFPATLLSNYSSNVNPFFGPGGTLGLGPSSTVLDQLYNEKLISARSYGLYIGSRPDREGGTQNGSIVMGGYDSGRYTGPLLTYDQVPALHENGYSPFKVSVSQLSLVTKQGQSIAMVTEGSFDAYLTTSRFPIQLPTSITQRLATALRAVPANNDDNTLRINSGFDGNLTITLSNNLTFTFDSSWVSNVSDISPLSAAPLQALESSNTTTEANDIELPILLGASFLSQVYLFVQYDNTPPSFSVAQALPYGKYVEPESYCPGMTPIQASVPKINLFLQRGLIGAVLGSVIGGTAIFTCLWFVCGRKVRCHLFQEPRSNTRPEFSSKPALKISLEKIRSKTKRDVHFGDSRKNDVEMEMAGIQISKKSEVIVTAAEVKNSRSVSSLSIYSSSSAEQDANQRSTVRPQVGLTITIPDIHQGSIQGNTITQGAMPHVQDGAIYNDVPLGTPIPPTPHSALPLLNQSLPSSHLPRRLMSLKLSNPHSQPTGSVNESLPLSSSPQQSAKLRSSLAHLFGMK